VRNEGRSVVIEVEAPALDAFAHALVEDASLPAPVDAVAARLGRAQGEPAFSIVASATAGPLGALAPPDVATCGDCCARCSSSDASACSAIGTGMVIRRRPPSMTIVCGAAERRWPLLRPGRARG
jgi:hypothetical protein